MYIFPEYPICSVLLEYISEYKLIHGTFTSKAFAAADVIPIKPRAAAINVSSAHTRDNHRVYLNLLSGSLHIQSCMNRFSGAEKALGLGGGRIVSEESERK